MGLINGPVDFHLNGPAKTLLLRVAAGADEAALPSVGGACPSARMGALAAITVSPAANRIRSFVFIQFVPPDHFPQFRCRHAGLIFARLH
jgi:hypothetical protein